MNNRAERMDEFLKFISSIYYVKPNIYGTLVTNGIKKHSIEMKPIAKIFPIWVEYFKHLTNIKVFNSSNWKYFCQFNKDEQIVKDNNFQAIKIYVPLDLAHIEEGANQLFTFIESKGFSHTSKICSDERVDNIVIRVITKEAANEIASFINTNDYIKEGLMKPNPFCLSDGNIAFATDNFLSFNSVLSEYIEDYMGSFQGNHNVGLEQFKSFVESRYQNYFVDGKYIDILANNKRESMSDIFKGDLNALLVNYQQVTELILKSLNSKSTLYDFSEHLDNLIAEKQDNYKYNNIKVLQNVAHESTTEELNKLSDIDILNDVIMTNYNKYGMAWVNRALNEFMTEKRLKSFTRDNGSREKMAGFSRNQVYNLIKNQLESEFNLESYIKDYINKIVNPQEVDFLKEACITTYQKYGFNHTVWAIVKYLRDNNPGSFTNKNSVRENLIINISSDDAKTIIIDFLAKRGKVITNNDFNLEFSEFAMEFFTILLKEIELKPTKKF